MIEFGQPAAFWTGLAIGLPILAHMAYRRITELHAFPSLRFITPSQIPRTGRKTPTDLPLLFLRILLFCNHLTFSRSLLVHFGGTAEDFQ